MSNKASISCIGIDPGLGRLGFALVRKEAIPSSQKFGCIETPLKIFLCGSNDLQQLGEFNAAPRVYVSVSAEIQPAEYV